MTYSQETLFSTQKSQQSIDNISIIIQCQYLRKGYSEGTTPMF